MGDTDYYLSRIDKHWTESPKRSQYVDLFLATTIAYGNMGWLVKAINPSEPFGVEAMTRSYYMMQQLQQQYAFNPPRLIQYADRDGKWYNPSQAIAQGVNAESRLHVVYENGTEVYVNRSADAERGRLRMPASRSPCPFLAGWRSIRQITFMKCRLSRTTTGSITLTHPGMNILTVAGSGPNAEIWARQAAWSCGTNPGACWT